MTSINLDQTSFPLYGIQSIDKELFVAAGGGGAAKTGVKNAIVCKINFIEHQMLLLYFYFKKYLISIKIFMVGTLGCNRNCS